MVTKIRKKFLKNKMNNSGAALIMVIVAIAFVGMLVAMIVYMAYANFQMKSTDKSAKNNFYSAESALDVVNVGLQEDISNSMLSAYTEVMKNSQTYPSMDAMENDFKIQYFNNLKLAIKDATFANQWSMDHIKKIWNTDTTITVASSVGEKGAFLETKSGTTPDLIQTSNSYLTLKNLRIIYTDDKGYVSVIETDIRIKVPDISFAKSATDLELEQYALIADVGIVADTIYSETPAVAEHTGGTPACEIKGNVFAGNDGLYVANQSKIDFSRLDTDPVDTTYSLVANSINIINAKGTKGLIINEDFKTYASDINVVTGALDLNGTSYIADDLNIDGTASSVTLGGIYRGYGNNLAGSDYSSSILINGAKSILDMSELEELELSGHAYVGTRHYDADATRHSSVYGSADDGTDYVGDVKTYTEAVDKQEAESGTDTTTAIPKNSSDILLSESVGVKADQLIYMIPADCMGYIAGTDQQACAKNPMTYDEYTKLTTTKVTDSTGTEVDYYDPVRLSVLWNKIGGSYTDEYKVVFRRVSGTVLAYFYLDFGSDEAMANAFFKAYYEYDTEGLDNYISSYLDVKNSKWNTALADTVNGVANAKLTLAGNVFYYNSKGELLIQDETVSDSTSKIDKVSTDYDTYSEMYDSMMHMLNEDPSKVSATQLANTLFNNVINVDFVNNTMKTTTFDCTTDASGAQVATSGLCAKVQKGDYVYTKADYDSGMKLVIATGNVYLRYKFDGLVIAGGSIYLGPLCDSITYNADQVRKAMNLTSSSGYHAYESIVNGANSYAISSTGGSTDDSEREKDYIKIGDLVVYQNWKKE